MGKLLLSAGGCQPRPAPHAAAAARGRCAACQVRHDDAVDDVTVRPLLSHHDKQADRGPPLVLYNLYTLIQYHK